MAAPPSEVKSKRALMQSDGPALTRKRPDEPRRSAGDGAQVYRGHPHSCRTYRLHSSPFNIAKAVCQAGCF